MSGYALQGEQAAGEAFKLELVPAGAPLLGLPRMSVVTPGGTVTAATQGGCRGKLSREGSC